MAQTYDSENLRLMRSPAKVGIRCIVGTTTILEFDNTNLISVKLDLRGVETKLDNPDLQVSTIEVQAYYNGSLDTLMRFRGKQTVIQYKASYGSTLWTNDVLTQYVGVRAFYATVDHEHITLKNNVLTIKGTDFVGTRVKQIYSYTYMNPSWQSYTYNGTSYYKFEDMVNTFNEFILPSSTWRMPRTTTLFTTGQFYFVKTAADYAYRWVAPEMSWRKRVAQLVNLCRGSTTEPMAPRAVFRDAGAPMFLWFSSPIYMGGNTNPTARASRWQAFNVSNNIYNDVWTNSPWNIKWEDVADFEIEYGHAISKVIIDNPYVGTEEVTQRFDMRPNMSDVIHMDTPGKFLRFTIYKSPDTPNGTLPTTYSLTQLDPQSAVLKCNGYTGECYANVVFQKWVPIYNNTNATSIPDLSINTGITNGDEIQLELLPAFRLLSGKYVPFSSGSAVDYSKYWHSMCILRSTSELNTAQPRWIKFKWRGHPGMQPRDIILFTEEDGTRNYYEIESLTLDHENGGLTSEVKAMFRMPYSS